MCKYCEQIYESNIKNLDYNGVELASNGQASLYMNATQENTFELIASDSWDWATISISYCPFCGKKL